MTVKETVKAAVPVRKVGASTLAGALTLVGFYVLGEAWDIQPSAQVGTAVTTLLAFIAGWITPAKEV